MTQWILVNRPWKNPNVGKTSEREGVLISSISGNYISAKIKPTEFTYLFPRFPCLKFTGRNPNLQPRFLCSDSRTVRTVTAINAVRISWKTRPEISCYCMTVVRPVRIIKCTLFLGIRAAVRPVPEKINAAVPNPYRTDLFLLLAASKSVP